MSQNPFLRNRNPLARVVRGSYQELATPALPRAPMPASIPPAEFGPSDAPELAEHVYERTGYRVGRFKPFPFLAQIASQIVVPYEGNRFYFFAVNNSGASQIFLGFDYDPSAANGLVLQVNQGFYEPWVIPTNAIHAASTANGVPGLILTCNTD